MRPFDKKLVSSLIYFLYLYTTIRPKIRVLVNLIFFLVHDEHSTKVRGHSYFLIYYFLNCANIQGSTSLIFCPFYPERCCSNPYISYTIFMEVLLLYFVRYVHGYMKSTPSVTLLGWNWQEVIPHEKQTEI